LGLSFFEAEDWDNAYEEFTRAINTKDDNGQTNENLSFYYKNRGLCLYH
jgi:lipoprotein NlpI